MQRLDYFRNISLLFDGYFDGDRVPTHVAVPNSNTATSFSRTNTANGITIDYTGTDFLYDADGNAIGGTVTGFDYFQGATLLARSTGTNWPVAELFAAIEQIGNGEGLSLWIALADLQNITVDASAATEGLTRYRATGTDFSVSSDITYIGSNFDDVARGGNGSDRFILRSNEGIDEIFSSLGNDIYDFSQADPNGFFEVSYRDLMDPIIAAIDTVANTSSITAPNKSDTFVEVNRVLDFDSSGWSLIGTPQGDTFNIVLGDSKAAYITPGAGDNVFNIQDVDGESALEITYFWGGEDSPPKGINANLSTGIVTNGFGGTDQINITGDVSFSLVTIVATNESDTLIGSDRTEAFRPRGSDDTVDGGDGLFDRVRYDMSDMTSGVTVNLMEGTATGESNGVAFTDTITGIEYVDGTRDFDDILIGNDEHNALRSRGGVSEVQGMGGDDLADLRNRDNDTGDPIYAGTFDGGEGADNLRLNGGVDDYGIFTHGDTLLFRHKDFTDEHPLGRVIAKAKNIEAFDGQFLSELSVQDGFAARATSGTDGAPSDLSQIRDFDGNDLGFADQWKLIGAVDVQFDGDAEYVYINQANERWATVGPDANGNVDFSDHGQGGETRVVGIYIDPLVESGDVEQFSDFDSQRRFQNDLAIDNLTVIDAFDFDADGFQEIYFKVNDGTAYLRALMHADGNIQYANYQNTQQVEDYLTGLGFGQDVLDAILV